jgi:hypothetical protein
MTGIGCASIPIRGLRGKIKPAGWFAASRRVIVKFFTVLVPDGDAGGFFAICANDSEHKLVFARVLVNFD